MTSALVAVAGVIVVVLVAYAVSYNRVVRARYEVADSWAAVDTELARRHDLIPPLVESVRAAAIHERALLVHLAEMQAAATAATHPSERNAIEHAVDQVIGDVVALLRERYPVLNSQASFLALQRELSLTEDRVAAARRYYNTRVAHLNRRVEAFPSNTIARHHRIAKAEFFGSPRAARTGGSGSTRPRSGVRRRVRRRTWRDGRFADVPAPPGRRQ